jgi:hypothetical protein
MEYNKMDNNNTFNDILFIVSPPFPDNPKRCKICGIKYDTENFAKLSSSTCRKCRSRESNFCRVRMILVRVLKKLNVNPDVAVKILQNERERIYKDIPNRKEKVVVI